MNEPSELSTQVLQALQQGRTVEAIKLLREERGIGLKEARELVDGWQADQPLPAESGGTPSGMSDQVRRALEQGHKIEAIRLLREERGLGLKASKETIEAWLAENPQLAQRCVRRGGSGGMLVVIVFLLLGVAAWLMLRS